MAVPAPLAQPVTPPPLTPTPGQGRPVLQHALAAWAVHMDCLSGVQHLAPIDIFGIKMVKIKKKKVKSSHGTICLCCLCGKPWGRKEHPGSAGTTMERGGQGPLPNRQRQHQPLCTGQSSRVSSTRLLLQPSPALRHSGTSSSSYLCKALEKHSCGLVRLKNGRAEGGRATTCLLASPHPDHLWLYHT